VFGSWFIFVSVRWFVFWLFASLVGVLWCLLVYCNSVAGIRWFCFCLIVVLFILFVVCWLCLLMFVCMYWLVCSLFRYTLICVFRVLMFDI